MVYKLLDGCKTRSRVRRYFANALHLIAHILRDKKQSNHIAPVYRTVRAAAAKAVDARSTSRQGKSCNFTA